MDNLKRFKEGLRLQREVYNDLNNPQHLGKFQDLVYDFMKEVRANALEDFFGLQLMNDFCALVDDDDVWHLAETKVPEFRLSWEEQKHSSADQACLINILHTLHQRNRLPPRRFDQGVLSSDQDLVQQRHNMFVEYLVTGGVGKKQATSKQLEDIDRRCKAVHEYRTTMLGSPTSDGPDTLQQARSGMAQDHQIVNEQSTSKFKEKNEVLMIE